MKKVLCIILVFVITVGLCSCDSFSGGANGAISDEMYIGVATQIISKSLKKPSSLEVIDAYIYEKDNYGSAIVYLDIASENGYGGTDRDKVYVCVMHLESDGTYQFHPTANYTENAANIGILKSLNGFGEPKE